MKLSNIVFRNWTGTEANGVQRGPIRVMCADGAPCKDITIEDFAMWTETGSTQLYTCRSAYTGTSKVEFCLKAGSADASYSATTITAKSAPTGYQAAKMPYDLTAAFGTTAYIPVPTWPASFFPGVKPISTLAAK